MSDLFCIASTLLLFGVSVLYTRGCDGMTRSRNHG